MLQRNLMSMVVFMVSSNLTLLNVESTSQSLKNSFLRTCQALAPHLNLDQKSLNQSHMLLQQRNQKWQKHWKQKLSVEKSLKNKRNLRINKWVVKRQLSSQTLQRPTTLPSKEMINATNQSFRMNMSKLRNLRQHLATLSRKRKPLKKIKSFSYKTTKVLLLSLHHTSETYHLTQKFQLQLRSTTMYAANLMIVLSQMLMAFQLLTSP